MQRVTGDRVTDRTGEDRPQATHTAHTYNIHRIPRKQTFKLVERVATNTQLGVGFAFLRFSRSAFLLFFVSTAKSFCFFWTFSHK